MLHGNCWHCRMYALMIGLIALGFVLIAITFYAGPKGGLSEGWDAEDRYRDQCVYLVERGMKR